MGLSAPALFLTPLAPADPVSGLLDPRQFDSRLLTPKDAHGIRVALVQPLIPDGNYLPNLGIMYLAGVLLKNGYDVRVFDENVHDNVTERICAFAPKLVGFTCVTAALGASCRSAAVIKQRLPGTLIAVGGPHLSAVPLETLRDNQVVDFGFTGEAERAILAFCDAALRDNRRTPEVYASIPGLVYRNSEGEVTGNRADMFLTDAEMDEIPFPAWHLLPIEEIFKKATHGLFSRGKRIMPVMTTRGCPNYCAFCCRVMGFKFRQHSIRRVLTEIRWLYDTYKIDEIYFEDDTFTQDPVRAHELLDGVISLKLPIYVKFANGLRADKVDRVLLDKMRQAGVYWVGFGIESGSPHTLSLMHKHLDLDLAEKNVRLAREMGFKVGSNCIIGYPGETKDSIRESLKYFLRLDLDSFAVVTCVPFPGTTAWQVCEKNGWFSEQARDYDNYWFEIFKVTPLVQTEFLSSKELSRAIFWTYIRFYFLNAKRLWQVSRLVLLRQVTGTRGRVMRWMRLLRANSNASPIPPSMGPKEMRCT